MKKSIFKIVMLFRFYSKTIRNNKKELDEKFGIRIDNVGRMYTVINIPPEVIGTNMDLKKSDIDRISSSYIDEFKSALATYLNSIGLLELYKEYTTTKVGKLNYLVIIGYSLCRSDIIAKNIFFKIIPILLILGSLFFYLFL